MPGHRSGGPAEGAQVVGGIVTCENCRCDRCRRVHAPVLRPALRGRGDYHASAAIRALVREGYAPDATTAQINRLCERAGRMTTRRLLLMTASQLRDAFPWKPHRLLLMKLFCWPDELARAEKAE